MQFFDNAETNGLDPLPKANVNSDKISKHLENGTEINDSRMFVLWDEYERRNPSVSAYEIKSAKHFIEGVLSGCSAGEKKMDCERCIPVRNTNFDG